MTYHEPEQPPELDHVPSSLLPIKPGILKTLLGLISILVMLLLVIVGWLVWASLSGRPTSHQELEQLMLDNNRRLQFTNCILLYEPDQRTPAAIAECQTILDTVPPEHP